MAKKVALVTGAYGFVGRHVARFFARKSWEVIGLGHGNWPRSEWQNWGMVKWHSCDITLDSLLTYSGKPDAIIHCAGSGVVDFSIIHPYQDYQRTVSTTLNVLEFARLYAPDAKVVFPSSAAVYGAVDKIPISETCALKPVSPYGVHKKIGEDLCRSYSKHFGIPTAILRLFSVYGAGLRKQLIWDACTKINNDEITFWGTGQETRDWLHIEDAAELLFKAAKHASIACPVVNGGSGVNVTINEVLTEIFSCFERSDSPKFLGSTHQGNPSHYMADITCAQALGWKPEIDWHDGIKEYAEWFKKEKL